MNTENSGAMMGKKRFDIVSLGELLIDFIATGKNERGMTLFEQNPGGAVANVSVAASRLGLRAAFIGKVGHDIHGRLLFDTLNNENVDTGNLIMSREHMTTLAFVELCETGDAEYSFYRNGCADLELLSSEIDINLLANTHILNVGTLSLTSEPARTATFFAVREACKSGAVIACDVNYRPTLWNSEKDFILQSDALLPSVNMLKVSVAEALILTGNDDPKQSALLLSQKYDIDFVAVTMGESGSVIAVNSGISEIKPFAANAVNTTGAGDSYWAGILCSFLSSGKTQREITPGDTLRFGEFASACASITVEKYGAIPALPTYSEVIKRING